jgi:lauroyl/myristoyl acyltransferase
MSVGRKFIKTLGREAGWFIIARILTVLQKDTDITVLHRRAELMGLLGMALMRSRRKLLLSNLRIAFPDWSQEGIEKTARKTVRNICRGFVDVFYHAYHLDLLPDHIRLEENGVLENLLMKKHGFIAATGHVGAFPYLGVPVVLRGFPFAPIARDPHDHRLKAIFDDSCDAAGYTIIPDRPPMTVHVMLPYRQVEVSNSSEEGESHSPLRLPYESQYLNC